MSDNHFCTSYDLALVTENKNLLKPVYLKKMLMQFSLLLVV